MTILRSFLMPRENKIKSFRNVSNYTLRKIFVLHARNLIFSLNECMCNINAARECIYIVISVAISTVHIKTIILPANFVNLSECTSPKIIEFGCMLQVAKHPMIFFNVHVLPLKK